MPAPWDLPAHAVAVPVLELLAGGPAVGSVLGAGRGVAWLELDGFVVALTAPGVPLLPNAVALAGGAEAVAGLAAGGRVRAGPGRLQAGPLTVSWPAAAPPAWEPAAAVATAGAGAVRERALAVLEAAGAGVVDPVLVEAVARRDPGRAAQAAGRLLGRGPGLTPEGDDLLAAAAGAVAAWGPATGFQGPGLTAWLAALTGTARPGRHGRTSALSGTLLGLAAQGRVLEPAGRLLDLSPAGARGWRAALARLERVGQSTGRAYAAGIGACGLALAAGPAVR